MRVIANRVRVLAILAMAMVIPSASLHAQNAAKPAVVIALKNLDELFGDLTAVAQWAGAADQIGFPLMLARGTTSKVDQNKPIGGYLTFDDGEVRPLIFIPVSDLNGLFAQLKEQIGSPKELEKGLYELRAGGQPMYVRQGDGWAFLANDRKTLDKTPANPAEALAALTKNYDIGVQVNIQNIPEDLRQVALTQIKSALEQAAQGAGDPAVQDQMRKNVQRQVNVLFEETDSITIGLAIDGKEQNVSLEFAMTANEGTDLAKQIAMNSNVKSAFAGLATDDSAASLNFAGKLAAEDVEQAMVGIKSARQQAINGIENGGQLGSEDDRKTAVNAMNAIFDAIEATLKGATVDFCASINLEEDEFHLIAGGLLVDGGKLESGIKQLVDLAKNEPGFPDVKLNVEAHQGVNFHTAQIPLDDADETVQEIFGESLEVTLGIGKDRMFLAIGDDGIGAIKGAMENAASGKNKSSLPMTLTIALAPILRFAASASEDENLERIATALAQTDGKDHIRVTSRTIPRGSVMRIEVEHGVLKAIGGAAAARNGRGGGF